VPLASGASPAAGDGAIEPVPACLAGWWQCLSAVAADPCCHHAVTIVDHHEAMQLHRRNPTRSSGRRLRCCTAVYLVAHTHRHHPVIVTPLRVDVPRTMPNAAHAEHDAPAGPMCVRGTAPKHPGARRRWRCTFCLAEQRSRHHQVQLERPGNGHTTQDCCTRTVGHMPAATTGILVCFIMQRVLQLRLLSSTYLYMEYVLGDGRSGSIPHDRASPMSTSRPPCLL